MAGFRRKSEFDELERGLRASRPEPSDDLIRTVSSRFSRGPSLRRLAAPRLAFAAALSALLLAAFGAFGGFGYASKAASGQITAFTNVKGKSSGNGVAASSSNRSSNSRENNNDDDDNGDNGDDDDNGDNDNGDNGNGDDDDDDDGPDDDQYKPGKGCGDKNHVHERENECKKPPK
jgi:hypothetical protein